MYKRLITFLLVISFVTFMMFACTNGNSQESNNNNNNNDNTENDANSNADNNADNTTDTENDTVDEQTENTVDYEKAKELVEKKCLDCHKMDRIEAVSNDKEGWTNIVEQMISFGAALDEEEKEIVIEYLSYAYGKEE